MIEDSRYIYEWSKYGILIKEKMGTSAGFYRIRYYDGDINQPTRLVLIGYRFGECPGERDSCSLDCIR